MRTDCFHVRQCDRKPPALCVPRQRPPLPLVGDHSHARRSAVDPRGGAAARARHLGVLRAPPRREAHPEGRSCAQRVGETTAVEILIEEGGRPIPRGGAAVCPFLRKVRAMHAGMCSEHVGILQLKL